jgi:hypothetical protein
MQEAVVVQYDVLAMTWFNDHGPLEFRDGSAGLAV